jgi:hypothetical protein
MKQMPLARLILRLSAARGEGDEYCCPIVLKIFHKRICIKNKDIYSCKSNAWVPYSPVPAVSRVPFRFGKEARETTILRAWMAFWLGLASGSPGFTLARSLFAEYKARFEGQSEQRKDGVSENLLVMETGAAAQKSVGRAFGLA